jgi:hypothetical protein
MTDNVFQTAVGRKRIASWNWIAMTAMIKTRRYRGQDVQRIFGQLLFALGVDVTRLIASDYDQPRLKEGAKGVET